MISMVVLCNRRGLTHPDLVSGAWRRIPRRSQPDAVLFSDRNRGAVGCCRPLCCHLCYIRSEFHIVLRFWYFHNVLIPIPCRGALHREGFLVIDNNFRLRRNCPCQWLFRWQLVRQDGGKGKQMSFHLPDIFLHLCCPGVDPADVDVSLPPAHPGLWNRFSCQLHRHLLSCVQVDRLKTLITYQVIPKLQGDPLWHDGGSHLHLPLRHPAPHPCRQCPWQEPCRWFRAL